MEKFKFNKAPDAIQLDITFNEKEEVNNLSIEDKNNIFKKEELDELYSGNDNREQFEISNRIKQEKLDNKNSIEHIKSVISRKKTPTSKSKFKYIGRNLSIEEIERRNNLK